MGQTKEFESVPQTIGRIGGGIVLAAGILLTTTIASFYGKNTTQTGPSEDVLKTATDCIVHQDNNGIMTHAILKIPNNPDHIVPLTPRTPYLNKTNLKGIGVGLRVTENIGTYDAQLGQQSGYLSCNFAGISKSAKDQNGKLYSGPYIGGTVLYNNALTPRNALLVQR